MMARKVQERCPICGGEFDIVEPVVHFGTRRHSYLYCECSRCKKAWEIGQFKFGLTRLELKEPEYSKKD